MRNYLLMLLALFLFISCKEEDKEPEPEPEIPQTTEELIQGNWYVVNEKYEYYNSSNQKVRETEGIAVQGEAQIDARYFKQNHSTGTLNSGYYSISNIAGAKYINISHDDRSSSSRFMLHIVNEKEMVWVRESHGDTYYNGTEIVTYSKTLFYITFKRK